MKRYHRITIITSQLPESATINDQLQYLGGSLGLFNLRDKDKSCFRIFITLLKASKIHTTLTSDELASQLQLSRGTVVHHLNKLMEAGIVQTKEHGYHMRVDNLSGLIEALQKDLEKTMDALQEVAKNIDKQLPSHD